VLAFKLSIVGQFGFSLVSCGLQTFGSQTFGTLRSTSWLADMWNVALDILARRHLKLGRCARHFGSQTLGALDILARRDSLDIFA
jgi:hypothetical protein